MNSEDFFAFIREFQEEMIAILHAKGDDYAGDADRLGNFYHIAATLGLNVRQIWAVYAQKHMGAIMTWVQAGKVSSESVHERFLDLANYCILGAALAAEAGDRSTGCIRHTLPGEHFARLAEQLRKT